MNTINKVGLASLARTANADTLDSGSERWKGAHIIIDVTAIVTAPSVVFTVRGKDDVSGNYYDLLVSAAITATGQTVLKVYPGALAVANLVANDSLPETFMVHAEHANADSITYSVAINMLN